MRRSWVVTLVVTALFGLALVGSATADDDPPPLEEVPEAPETADAAGPQLASTIGTATGLYPCGDTTKSYCKQKMASLNVGNSVTMRCYHDWKDSTGKSWRWFYITTSTSPYREGFVHAEVIPRSSQTVVDRCDRSPATTTTGRIHAASWTLRRIPSTAYDNLCLKFMRDAYLNTWGKDINTVATNTYSAHTYWSTFTGTKHTSSDPRFKLPPRGALVFWKGRTGFPEGHVAVSIGNGWLVSSAERSLTGVHLVTIAQRNADSALNAVYAGWVMPF